MNYSAMENEAELEYQFPFQDEEELPFQNYKKDVPMTTKKMSPKKKKAPEYFSDDDDEDIKVSNAFTQVLDTDRDTAYSAMQYKAELKKRGAPFKHCLVNRYLHKFPFEDKDDIPSSEYYTSDDDESVKDPNAHEIVKRFLKQVRESNGETYELVQVDKLVYTSDTSWILLTFTVKKVGTDDDGSLKTIRAMVYEPRCKSDDYMLEEWMFKPPATDISKGYMDPEKKKAKIGESKGNVVGLSGVETSVLEHIFPALDKRSAISLSLTCKSCWSTWVSLKKSSTQIHN